MGATGSTHGAFQRACDRGNVSLALQIAKELGTLSLEDALAVTMLLARVGDGRFQRAAVRWLGRLGAEREVTLSTFAAAVRLLGALPDEHAHRMLRALIR